MWIEVSGYYYDGRSHNVLAECTDQVWNMNQYERGRKDSRGNIQGHKL
ncbi:hypothetical protein [Natronospora cellulosivora (SeqCode)]